MRNKAASALARLAVAASFCIAIAGATDVNSLPPPTGYVNDFANVISPPEKQELEELCRQVDRQLGVQFAFVTVGNIGDTPIRDFGLDLGRKWGVGSKKTNQGLLAIFAVQQHQDDIEVGRGLEPYVTDGFAGGVRRAMAPDLRAGAYGAALLGAGQTLAEHIAEGKGVSFTFQTSQPVPRRRPVRRQQGIPGWVIVLAIFFFFWIIGRGGRRGPRGGGGIGNFATGMLIGDLLSGGRRGGGWGDSGGGGFGGDSGGGGGFGGFGGGDFGGGGASGNW